MGNGKYASLMPYDKWVSFNNAQRAHYNMVEISGPTLACLLGGGLYHPRACAAMGFAFAFGRVLYAVGYNTKKGADGRLVGVVIAEIAVVGLFGLCMWVGAVKGNAYGILKGALGL